uniref:Uncharacterized protein n=1 Tax=Ceratitis capitata TaxID=7213 RepID=W8BBH4_CERCA
MYINFNDTLNTRKVLTSNDDDNDSAFVWHAKERRVLLLLLNIRCQQCKQTKRKPNVCLQQAAAGQQPRMHIYVATCVSRECRSEPFDVRILTELTLSPMPHNS